MDELTDQEIELAVEALRGYASNERAIAKRQFHPLTAAPYYRRADQAEDLASKMDSF